jgi:ribosomal protein S18 acetylase RimI-like enzyme
LCLCTLRKLKDTEMAQALSLLQANLQWLEERGIRQWSADVIKRAYPEYQKAGENFAFEHEHQIVAVLSIHKRVPAYWGEMLNTLDHRFLSKLAVDVNLRGLGLGRRAIRAVQRLLRDEKVKEFFIEVSHEKGFLVQYYKELDFVVVDRTDTECESGIYDMVLMKCTLRQ